MGTAPITSLSAGLRRTKVDLPQNIRGGMSRLRHFSTRNSMAVQMSLVRCFSNCGVRLLGGMITLQEITSEVNSHLRNPISARTIQRELHASNLYGRVGIRKPLVTARHALQRRQWCRIHRQWTPQQWQQVIWLDESTFTLFQTTGRVYEWRTPKEAFSPECIVPTVKHGGGSLMVHPFVQTSFPGESPFYQDDNAPIHNAKIVQEWFADHEVEVGHLYWPPQSPDLNIIEHLWGYLESKLRARFPLPSTISALETALHEE
ncbi:transposable element Tcb1 transposase [Trichonephila clavipes]|nr:transposable element Tcb1 transposase [Trichonephila clavipes]